VYSLLKFLAFLKYECGIKNVLAEALFVIQTSAFAFLNALEYYTMNESFRRYTFFIQNSVFVIFKYECGINVVYLRQWAIPKGWYYYRRCAKKYSQTPKG
jgi:hypothetical protein